MRAKPSRRSNLSTFSPTYCSRTGSRRERGLSLIRGNSPTPFQKSSEAFPGHASSLNISSSTRESFCSWRREAHSSRIGGSSCGSSIKASSEVKMQINAIGELGVQSLHNFHLSLDLGSL